ncbi:MAG: DNA translocase FtsK [Dehalococcoidia bacterium]|nr:DNA translocase FtsK [Dehalococcoidia bacterium]
MFRAQIVLVVVLAAAIAALPWFFDVVGIAQDVRTWLIETFGLGLIIVAAVLLAWAVTAWRRGDDERLLFWRRIVGYPFLALFAWGALGLNTADWTVAGVQLRDVTLGGEIGHTIVTGWINVLVWIASAVVALALLVPRPSLTALQYTGRGLAYAWERRWPHQVLASFWRGLTTIARLFRRRERAGTAVIGGAESQSAVEFEPSPIIFRPRVEPGAPHADEVAEAPTAQFEDETEAPAEPDPVDSYEDAPDDMPEPVEEEEPHQLAFEDKSGWQLPPIELLQEPKPSRNHKHDNAARAQLIVDTLASFGVDASVVEINEGPAVTQFGVEPGWEIKYKDVPVKDADNKPVLDANGRPTKERVETGRTRVRVNKITALQSDLALALAAPSLRIEAPVPGRAIVGIEVPNETASVVTLRNVMESSEYQDMSAKSKLAISLGKGVSGVPVVADLAKMPHLLIAGATGSGKSVCLNAIVTNLITNATPDEVRFIMIDPKRVEMTTYGRLPHLAFSEVIVDLDKVVGTLQAVVSEMEARYRKFSEVGVRNIEAYNRHARVLKKLPYWVLIIDELADLMMVAPFEVEKLLCRLAQLARATGIHLVVATQRPSVDVVTGLIKANFPTRVAFAVTSITDSRTILDMGGAEKLLGQGDMLYLPTDAGKPKRIQGVYVSDAEVERLVGFWADERFHALRPDTADDLLEEALIAQNGSDDIDVEDGDPLLDDARDLASRHTRLSPSLLQRRLNVGFLKAERLITALEREGVLGPRIEGESREVLAGTAPEEDA